MKKSYILIRLLAVAGAMTSCSDTWDNHSEPSERVAKESVIELMKAYTEI